MAQVETNVIETNKENVEKLSIIKLMMEIKKNNIKIVQHLLATHGLPVSTKLMSDYDLLQTAMVQHSKEIVKILLQYNCSVNDHSGKSLLSTPLYIAVELQYKEIIGLLLKKGAIIDLKDTRTSLTPVQAAIKNKQFDIVYTLLGFNTNVNIKDEKNRTILHMFLEVLLYEHRKTEKISTLIIQRLLAKGASVNCKSENGETLLHLAAMLKQKDILPILLQGVNFNVNECDKRGYTVLHVLLSSTMENAIFKKEEDCIEIVKTLLKLGAKTNVINVLGQTPLHLAAKNRYFKVLALLLDTNGLATNVNLCDYRNKTILHRLLDNLLYLTSYLMTDVKKLVRTLMMLCAKVDVKCKGQNGETALHLAARNSSLDIFYTLLPRANDINVCDDSNNTILHFLVTNRRFKINALKLLLKKGMQVNVKNSFGHTPFHVAARKKRIDLLPIFLKHDFDLNALDRSNETILHKLLFDCTGKEIKILNDLLNKGASVEFLDNLGMSALHYAVQHKEMLLLLLEKCPVGSKVINASSSTVKSLMYTVLQNANNSAEPVDEVTCNVVKMLLAKGAYIDTVEENCMPLNLVKRKDDKNLTQIFVQFTTKSNIFGNNGRSIPMFLDNYSEDVIKASEDKFVELVEIFLRNGLSLENEHSSFAMIVECKKLSQILLQYSKDLSKWRDEFDNTVLHIALIHAEELTVDTVKLMLSKGVPVDVQNLLNKSALILAAEKKNLEILKLVLAHSCEVNAVDNADNNILHILLDGKKEIDKADLDKTISVILSAGVAIDMKNEAGETPLHLACKNRLINVLKILLKKGADPKSSDKFGKSALHIMSQTGKDKAKALEKKILQLLIKYGCNLNATDFYGKTPLHIAAECGSFNLVEALVENGSNINSKKKYDNAMPIHLAAKTNNVRIVELLLQSGADVNVRQGDGQTALHLSTQHASAGVLKLLLTKGADVELRDRHGRTPLQYACWYENAEAIDQLLNWGADINSSDVNGRLPFCQMLKPNANKADIKLINRVMQLKVAKLPLNEINCKALVKSYARVDKREFMENLYASELDELKKVKIDSRTTLFNLLHMSENKLAIYHNNHVFKELVTSFCAKKKFIRYGNLIEACLRKGKMRNHLLKAAKDALKNLSQFSLPDACSEQIFEYLNNENLRYLISAGSFNTKKRKIDSIDRKGPMTRQRRKLNS